jgi:hypothetical protein
MEQGKYRKENIKLIGSQEIIECLNVKNVKCRFQMKMNRFLIWKYTARWSVYVEIVLLNENLIFGNICSKKRRRVELLYDLFRSILLVSKFKREKLYEINDEENWVQLINFARKKKRRKNNFLLVKGEEEKLLKEDVCKSWNTMRKKSSDKKNTITFSSLSRKGLILLKSVLRRNKMKLRRKRVERNEKELTIESLVQDEIAGTMQSF